MSKRYNTQTIKLTAGLHRQTWISGYLIFVDIHIDNKSSKAINRVELQLEKTTIYHSYPAPSTNAGSADVLRLPDHRQTEIIVRKDVADGFQGVPSLSQELRTCHLELPTGLVSIETGVYLHLKTSPMRKLSFAGPSCLWLFRSSQFMSKYRSRQYQRLVDRRSNSIGQGGSLASDTS